MPASSISASVPTAVGLNFCGIAEPLVMTSTPGSPKPAEVAAQPSGLKAPVSNTGPRSKNSLLGTNNAYRSPMLPGASSAPDSHCVPVQRLFSFLFPAKLITLFA